MDDRITLEHDIANSRVDAFDGQKKAGSGDYSVHDGYWSINYIYVHPSYRGRQLGERLVDAIVMAAREAGVKVTGRCSFAASVLERRDAYQQDIYPAY